MPEVYYPLILVLGACFGSLFNVCIYRIPLGISLFKPDSHCPKCKQPIRPWHNIPVFSYLILRGKCARCGVKYSSRYMWVELLSALLFLALFIFRGEQFDLDFARWAVFTAISIIIVFIDYDHLIIPDILVYPLLIFGLMTALIPDGNIGIKSALIGGGSGFLFFYLLQKAYALLRGQEGLGGGDLKYIAAIGTFAGFPGVLFILVFASVFGVVSVVLFPRAFMRVDPDQPPAADGSAPEPQLIFPFGPFLAIGTWFWATFGQYLFDWYWELVMV